MVLARCLYLKASDGGVPQNKGPSNMLLCNGRAEVAWKLRTSELDLLADENRFAQRRADHGTFQ